MSGESDALGAVETVLGVGVESSVELDGGEVGTARRVDLADGRTVVVKTGETPLSVEASMLRHLAAESDLPVPEVLAASDDLLVLEYVAGDGGVTPAVERDAAAHLASLHGVECDRCGFPFDTLSGTLEQPNPWTDSWVEFFGQQRLVRAAAAAREAGRLSLVDYERVTTLACDLDSFLREPDAPALVHGDVWEGNLVVDGDRVAAFLDPACYYGHPEVDLAYVDWTDTFGEAFFARYRDLRGIEDGFFETRRDVYALYPILEHAWFFGEGYAAEVDRILTKLGY
ncbi:MAG: fructosamine kinase family protein [Haloferacaceae archaeon]